MNNSHLSNISKVFLGFTRKIINDVLGLSLLLQKKNSTKTSTSSTLFEKKTNNLIWRDIVFSNGKWHFVFGFCLFHTMCRVLSPVEPNWEMISAFLIVGEDRQCWNCLERESAWPEDLDVFWICVFCFCHEVIHEVQVHQGWT